MTAHRTYVCCDNAGNFFQTTKLTGERECGLALLDWQPGNRVVTEGPFKGYTVVSAGEQRCHLKKDGFYLCAINDGREVVTNRSEAREWETFWLVSLEKIASLQSPGTPDQEVARLRNRIFQLAAEGSPVKLQFGAGTTPRNGFLNIDKNLMATEFSIEAPENYFIFPFADMPWGIPDDCVDYIFHEDFIEHIDQTSQFQFLAEALRVLKPGCWHRVNTPDLLWSMKTHSNFTRGLAGVYSGERQWGHIAMLTHNLLAEMARTVGYKEVVFTTRDHGVSPHSVADYRPQADRDSIVGNIFADLLKG